MNNQIVIQKILEVAVERDSVRLVVLNGSLANPNASKDPYQDVDVILFVRDVTSFIQDSSWIERFGELLIMQKPDGDVTQRDYESYTYLIQFTGGHRIDLTVRSFELLNETLASDSLSLVLLDKDQVVGEIVPTEQSYFVERPSAALYDQCWNEFWWVSLYVVKGLRRNQLLYAIDHVQIMREMLRKMMEWKIGFETDFSVNLGKSSDGIAKYVSSEVWMMYLSTYQTKDEPTVIEAFETLIDQFLSFSQSVAERAGFRFHLNEAEKVRMSYSTLWTSRD